MFGCSRPVLPPIKDTETFHKDCITLFEKFPISETQPNTNVQTHGNFHGIPKEQWPASVNALQPSRVAKDSAGIWLFFDSDLKKRPMVNGCVAWGYLVLVNPGNVEMPLNFKGFFRPRAPDFSDLSLFIFKGTGFENVFQVFLPIRVL
jgi:hypothetical protein